MKIILIVLLGLNIAYSQVSHDPIALNVIPVYFSPNIKTVPSDTAFRTTFPEIGYQIGGAVY